MQSVDRSRELLVADLALRKGYATPDDVQAAIHALWEEGESRTLPFLEASPEALADLHAEVDALVEAAGGNAQAALLRHGTLHPMVGRALTASLKSRARATATASSRNEPTVPEIQEGRYVDFIPVAEGGMGIVYMALDTVLHRLVAFKVVRTDAQTKGAAPTAITPLELTPPPRGTPSSSSFDELRRRILQEAWVTGGLEHPGIVPVYELGKTSKGVPYYTMRFVEGQRTLATALEAMKEKALEERLALLEPFLKLCDTLAYAHAKHVVHRDLKPENVALGEYGEVILLDWGLAKLQAGDDQIEDVWQERVQQYREVEDLKTIATMLGTPGYMAPEAALGKVDAVDPQSDVYSLGVILFEILTGRRPFTHQASFSEYVHCLLTEEAPDARSLDPSVPKDLATLCARTLAREKGDRPDGAADVASAIRRWQASSALDREMARRLARGEKALDRAASLRGAERLSEIDQATALLLQVTAKRPNDSHALALLARGETLREADIQEREFAASRKARRREAVRVVLVLVGLVGLVFAGLQAKQWVGRTRAERAQQAMEAGARTALAKARAARDTATAIPLLEALLERFPEAAVTSEAHVHLGRRYEDVGQHERAQATWAEAWVAHPAQAWGRRAMRILARSFALEGRLEDAAEAADAALAAATPGAETAESLLLAAELAWGRSHAQEAAGYLQELDGAKTPPPPAVAEREAALKTLMARWALLWEARIPELIGAEPGHFRPGSLEIVLATRKGAAVHVLDANGLDPEPRLHLPFLGPNATFTTLDVDGDGIDELVGISGRAGEPMARKEFTERLMVFDLRGEAPKVLFEMAVEASGYRFASGDLDGDGDLDLVLCLCYPRRGVRILAGDGRGGFEDMPLDKVMEDLNEGHSEVFAGAIGDVTGDGRNELLLCTGPFKVFDLLAFRHDPTDGLFHEIPVTIEGHADVLGIIPSCALVDLDGDRRKEVLFGQDLWLMDGLSEVYARCLPQGLYVADWDAESDTLHVHAIDATRRVLTEPVLEGDAPPTNVGTLHVVVPPTRSGVRHVCQFGKTLRGRAGFDDHWIRFRPLDRLQAPPFVRRQPSQVAEVRIADLDGDGDAEMITVLPAGRLQVLGRAPGRPAPSPDPRGATRTAASPPTLLERQLAVARRLGRMGFHAQAEHAYQVLEASAPDATWRREAFLGQVSALAYQGRYDTCIHRLDEYLARDAGAREVRLLRARYLERVQRWPEAAHAYHALIQLGGLSEERRALAASRDVALAPWRDLEDQHLPPPTAWGLRGDKAAFAVDPEGTIHVGTEAAALATLPLTLTGTDPGFLLSFEFKVEALALGHLLNVGFLPVGVEGLSPLGLYATIGSDSDRALFLNLLNEKAPVTATPGLQPLATVSLETGRTYGCELAWSSGECRLGFALRDMETGALLGSSQRPVAFPASGGPPLRLAIQSAVDRWPGRTTLTLSNLSLRRPQAR